MADATVRGYLSSYNTGINNIVLAVPTDATAPVAGDWMIATIVDTAATGTGVTVTPPSGWTTLLARTTIGSRSISIFGHRRVAGETTYTFNYSANSATNGSIVYGPGGVVDPASWQLGTTTVASASSTSQTLPSMTTTAKSLVLALFGLGLTNASETDAQNTVASPFTKLLWAATSASGNSVNKTFIAKLDQTAAGATGAATWTHATAGLNQGGRMVAIPTLTDVSVPNPIVVSVPAANAALTSVRPTISGTSSPSASIAITNAGGTTVATATAATDGSWSTTPTVDLPAGSQTLTATQTAANGAKSSTTQTFSVELSGQYYDGTTLKTGFYRYFDGTSEKSLTKAVVVWPGRKVADFFSGKTPVVAHRCGSRNFQDHTLRGATQSAINKVTALEISVAMSSDGVFFGAHDADANRTSPSVGATSWLWSAHTWAEIQALSQTAPVGNDSNFPGPNPYYKLTDFLDAYAKTHTIFIDPKVIATANRPALYAILQSYPDAANTFVGKYYHTGTNVAAEFRAMGMKTWGYGYQSDVDGTAGTTQMSTTLASWDWLGMDYGASAAAWATVVGYGKPVLVHIAPTWAAAQTGLGYGAVGVMASGVNEVTAGIRAQTG